jgi:hypothetical protein
MMTQSPDDENRVAPPDVKMMASDLWVRLVVAQLRANAFPNVTDVADRTLRIKATAISLVNAWLEQFP